MATRSQVVEMIVGGKTPKQVSEELGITTTTVYGHLANAGQPYGRMSGRGRPRGRRRTRVQVTTPKPANLSEQLMNGEFSPVNGHGPVADARAVIGTAVNTLEDQIALKLTEVRGLEVQHKILIKTLADLSAAA